VFPTLENETGFIRSASEREIICIIRHSWCLTDVSGGKIGLWSGIYFSLLVSVRKSTDAVQKCIGDAESMFSVSRLCNTGIVI
jgi:hypothetical protein